MIRSAGSDGAVFHAELTDNSAIEQMFQDIAKTFGGLDILVNSASVFSPATADKTTPELWDSQMDSNAKAPFFVAQHAARLMQARGQGKIVNIADVAGEVIWPGYFSYSVSKAALIAVSRGLAKSYAPQIQVNAIAPGPVLFPDYYTEEQKRSAIERTLLEARGKSARHRERGGVSNRKRLHHRRNDPRGWRKTPDLAICLYVGEANLAQR